MATSQKNNSLSNLQWFFLFMLALAVDVVQIILNLAYGSGAIANRPISVGFGFALLLVFHLKDVPLSPAQYTSIAGAFIGEEVPVVDFLPFWAGVVGGLLASIKLAELADKMGVVGKVAQMALKKKGGGAGAAGATAGATSAGGAIAGAAEDAAGNAAQNVTQNIGQGSVIDLRPKA